MASNQTQAVKDPVQLEEERLEDAFAHLNQLHLQASSALDPYILSAA